MDPFEFEETASMSMDVDMRERTPTRRSRLGGGKRARAAMIASHDEDANDAEAHPSFGGGVGHMHSAARLFDDCAAPRAMKRATVLRDNRQFDADAKTIAEANAVRMQRKRTVNTTMSDEEELSSTYEVLALKRSLTDEQADKLAGLCIDDRPTSASHELRSGEELNDTECSLDGGVADTDAHNIRMARNRAASSRNAVVYFGLNTLPVPCKVTLREVFGIQVMLLQSSPDTPNATVGSRWWCTANAADGPNVFRALHSA